MLKASLYHLQNRLSKKTGFTMKMVCDGGHLKKIKSKLSGYIFDMYTTFS